MAKVESPWEQAVDAVMHGLSIRKAARTFPGVEREALRRRIHGLVDMHAKPGRRAVYLSRGHEQGILEVVAARAHMGFCVEELELRYIVRQCALAHRPPAGVPPGFPNKWWIGRFVKRHKKEMSWRKPQILDEKRADHSTEEIVRGYAGRLEPVVSGVAAECIWNCDETGVCAQGAVKTRVLCSRGLAANTRRSHDRENVSMMGCVNAAGRAIPLMYIFAGEHRKLRWLDDAVDGAVCAMTESSNINGNVFFHWLKVFVNNIGEVRPQVLTMDGHFSHLSQQAVEFAVANNIKLFLLPSHTSHFLQPLDVSVFRTFKDSYNDALVAFPRLKGLGDAALPTRDDIPALTRVPFEKAFTPTCIRRGFFKTGIFPFNVDIMLEMMVGSLSTQHKKQLPHHAALEASAFDLHLTERQKLSLQRQGLDLDALNVVAFHAKNLVIPQIKPRARGSFVTASMTEGVLLRSVEMRDAFNAHAELKAMRAQDTESNRFRRYTKRVEADRIKAAMQQAAKKELMERRAMRQEDVAALKARRFEQRADATQRRAEGKTAARNAKAVQRAANRKSGRRPAAPEKASPQRKRRVLHDITAAIQNLS